jgi:hypothetical protein
VSTVQTDLQAVAEAQMRALGHGPGAATHVCEVPSQTFLVSVAPMHASAPQVVLAGV